MLMNVLETIIVITMQYATTLKGVTLALATLDTQAVDVFAQVTAFFFNFSSYVLLSFRLATICACLHSGSE